MRKKIIQVPIPEDLLSSVDELSRQRGESRSALIREACTEYMARAREAELDRQYVEGDRKLPETEEEREWAEFGASQLARYFADEEEND